MSIIRVVSEQLPPGALPVYDFGCGWPYPVFSVAEDGESVLRFEPGKSRYIAPEFTLENESPDELGREVLARITTMCVCAGFAGKVRMAVRNEMAMSNPVRPKSPILSFSVAMLFSIDWDPDEGGTGYRGMGWRVPADINELAWEGDNEDFVRTATVMEVLLS